MIACDPTTDPFWSKVDASGDCWEWTGGTGKGYGRAKNRSGLSKQAHRVAYELLVGPVPEGLQIDHLCRNRTCVNPDHLEVVTSRVNTRRGFSFAGLRARQTECVNGHAFDAANTYLRPDNGTRVCRICVRVRQRVGLT